MHQSMGLLLKEAVNKYKKLIEKHISCELYDKINEVPTLKIDSAL